ncbi:anthranilate synthase component II [Chitinophaga pinensis]|jgi:anthranilate synthase component 2|uniref:Glutamine amidotransferase of anthranilate synthase n=1 Tax=Chitinophaga pinensis (strain ATCC 43595 / DSM 2588 / LMG 13176 / NBRC 15968 / NCIMB 11800 / UQM 2034) TaxID=485918 RepID=A0A979G1X8_CHIPD|nr:aminodeoxychorismate/anthranilate synthase component II [Chitinophaga pinensis]ACU59319.1 glutamine amidotransferase of anthranilate synthase [Chitinophaga pinensis DSM 2588]
MNILVFDNYDSFTYNLVHLVEKIINGKVTVVRNDEIPLEKVKDYDKIILSPGPGIPEEAGLLLPLIKEYAPSKSIFGVCLGQQAIGEAFGAKLINLKDVYHGVATNVNITARDGRLFNGLPDTLEVGRYHSWVVDEATLPAELTITAKDDNNYIMALQHNTYDVSGVQFHPESVLTPRGEQILRNWLNA